MNPLLNNPTPSQSCIPPQLQQGIQRAKGLMHMMQSNPMAMLQQNPMVAQMNQVAQMFKGQNLQDVFYNMCKLDGTDPNAILRDLQQ